MDYRVVPEYNIINNKPSKWKKWGYNETLEGYKEDIYWS
jgi:hypothetical protein